MKQAIVSIICVMVFLFSFGCSSKGDDITVEPDDPVKIITPTKEVKSWKGKKIFTLGDSILDPTFNGGVGAAMLEAIKTELEFSELIMDNVAGSTVADLGHSFGSISLNTVIGKYETAAYNDVDVVFITRGTNDYGMNATLGNIESTDRTNFYGGLKVSLNYFKQRWPNAEIVYATPIIRQLDDSSQTEKFLKYRTAEIEVCELLKVNLFDLYIDSTITADTLGVYTFDGLHPSSEGYRVMKKAIKDYLVDIDNFS